MSLFEPGTIVNNATLLLKILDQLPSPVFVKDEQLRLAFLNAAACAGMGVPKEELLGKSDDDFYPTEQAKKFRARDRHVIATGAIDEVEETIVDSTGAQHPILTKMSRLIDDDGKCYILGLSADLSEIRKREQALEVKEARYRALAETAPVGIWQVEQSGRTVYVNPGLLELLGMTEEEFCAADKLSILGATKEASLESLIGSRRRFETDLIVAGSIRARVLAVSSGWVVGSEGSMLSAMVTFVDISETSHLQMINDEITRLNKELSDSLSKLRDAQDEIIKSGKMAQLGQLTAMVAHELRNPLGAVRTSAFVLERKLKDKALGVDSQLQRITNGVVRCDNIITQLLDFTRSKSLQLEEIDLDSWLLHLVEEEAAKLPETVEVECSLGLAGTRVRIDPSRMSRVLINLISNAAEAMVGKGETRVDTKSGPARIAIATRLTSRGVDISVEDNGPGILPEILDKLFEPLFTTKSFGTGLGLPAVRNILRQHDGELEVSSTLGEGARFVAWLPVEPERAEAAA